VFTANDPGEYRFCFNNEMSTFAEKMVDFEIAVSLYGGWGRRGGTMETMPLTHLTGRKRSCARNHPLEARFLARTNHRPRRVHPQALRPAVHNLPQPEILPHAREPKLQHGQEHGRPHLHIQLDGEWPYSYHGGTPGLHRQVLLPGRKERYIMIPFKIKERCVRLSKGMKSLTWRQDMGGGVRVLTSEFGGATGLRDMYHHHGSIMNWSGMASTMH
jgi:hypothetical protein